MRIVTDCHFEIGHGHWVCEDYACHGRSPVPHVIVADGCSAAGNVDVGARLMTLNARQALPTFARLPDEALTTRHWQIGRQIVIQSVRQASSLGLSATALDSTLLIALIAGDRVRVHVYGDGCLLGRRHDGSLRIVQIEFAHNAPYYLTYLQDRARQNMYADVMRNLPTPQIHRWLDGQTQRIETHPYDAPGIFEFPLDEFPIVAVASDGLSSFINRTNREPVGLWTGAEELMKFRNLNGDFVKRRLRRTLEHFAKRDIVNFDDIGCGVLASVDSEDTAESKGGAGSGTRSRNVTD